MRFTFQPVKLSLDFGDADAVLAFRSGALIAVLCKLGDLHGEKAGQWFVEASFLTGADQAGEIFPDLPQFEERVGGAANH